MVGNPLPLRGRVVDPSATRIDRVRGACSFIPAKTPYPARCSLALAPSHPLPQGERGRASAARLEHWPVRERGGGRNAEAGFDAVYIVSDRISRPWVWR